MDRICLTVICCICYIQSLAQTPELEQKTSYGIGVGIVGTSVKNKPNGFNHSAGRDGLNAYVFLNAPLGSDGLFTLRFELAYEGLGFQHNAYKDSNYHKGINAEINYLSFAILPRLNIYDKPNLYFSGGFSIGYLLNDRTTDLFNGELTNPIHYKPWNVSGLFGLEYYMPINLGFRLMGSLGLTNISRDMAGGGGIHFEGMSLTLSYRFHW